MDAGSQAAGFLPITNGDNPLDSSAVHPEAYPVVARIVERTGMPIRELVGRTDTLRALRPDEFVDDRFGVPTVTDIIAELEKPGRDPRPEFRTATFREGCRRCGDLHPGMMLEGVVAKSPISAHSSTWAYIRTASCTCRSSQTASSRTRARW